MAENHPPTIVEHRHWVEQLGQKVVERGPGPYIVTAGMTTSGPAHMGTLCEMLYPQAISRHLNQTHNPTQYIFIADIMDAFDAVPLDMQKYSAQLTPHLGKPLYAVPDPTGASASFGEHYLSESFEIGRQFNIAPKIMRAQELYSAGHMDRYARLFIEQLPAVRELVATTSLKPELPADWAPIMPICENCGRISTTRVISMSADRYSYSCDKDVKYTNGCGHSGSNAISDHKYKLTWRLHWPAWMDHFNTSIEGGGVDHFTRGGSWDTAQAVFRGIFHKEPPIGYQFGFVLFMGKKYSKSKGIGMGVRELLSLIPAPILSYALLRPDLNENRDINPTAENLLRLMNEFEEAGRLAGQMGLMPGSSASSAAGLVHQTKSPSSEISRAERKKALAFALASPAPIWPVPFTDLLIYYGLYGDWDRVAAKLGEEQEVMALSPYIQAWKARGMIPDIYNFKFQARAAAHPNVREWAQTLRPEMDALAIHNSVFAFSKSRSLSPAQLFGEIYSDLLSKSMGPKLGRLVEILGVQRVRDALLATTGQ
jgi:lysyl-tRNA synthetase class 1